MGPVNRKATPAELEKMRGLVQQGMDDGAFGLSSGLFYVPGTFTPTAEVVELARVAGGLGGIYISHMRDEASRVLDSVARDDRNRRERRPADTGHASQDHRRDELGKERRDAEADRRGPRPRCGRDNRSVSVHGFGDQHSGRTAAALGARRGPRQPLETDGNVLDARSEIRAEIIRIIREERGGGDPQNVQLARCEWDQSLAGKRLGDVTKGRGLEPTVENAADTVLWIVEKGGCQGIFHAISEEDLQRILKHPATMIGSDGEIPIFGQASPHPRSYGTFVRVLGRYVRELKIITLEDAVRKMSAFPAQRIGLNDRGVLREGLKADIAVFDPVTVRDHATFEQPHQYAEGVVARCRQRSGRVRRRKDDRRATGKDPVRACEKTLKIRHD